MRLSLNCLEYNHVLYQNLYFKVSRTASFQQLSLRHYIRHSIWSFQPSAPCSNFCPSSRNGDSFQVWIKNKFTVIAIVLFKLSDSKPCFILATFPPWVVNILPQGPIFHEPNMENLTSRNDHLMTKEKGMFSKCPNVIAIYLVSMNACCSTIKAIKARIIASSSPCVSFE